MSSWGRELLDQASSLATLDKRGAPKQVNLRRSVSSAYYAVFHLLVDNASGWLGGAKSERANLLSRAFAHSEMREVCKAFAGGKLKSAVARQLPSLAVPVDLRIVADVFVDLQQKRHDADYNPARKFTRKEALDEVDQARRAFEAYRRLVAQSKQEPEKQALRAFQVCLLVYARVKS